MRRLTLSLLAASVALIPAAASAEQRHRPGPAPGHQWRGGGMHGGNVIVRHGGPRFMHPGRNFQHRRLRRGFFVHPFWFGPQFHVGNWQVFGFADPGPDHRWIRYYDDAYMIDRGGRVVETRENFDWDSYGEQWEMQDGIPAYRGSRDYRPTEEDYAWFERREREARADGPGDDDGDHGRRGGHDRGGHDGHGSGHARHGGWDYGQYGHGRAQMHGHGAHQSGYGYYGYGYAYPIIIETTVTTGATAYSEEVIEEYVDVRRAHRRVRRAPARPARPRPPAGERG